MKKALIALGLVAGIAAVPAVANATPGQYTTGGNVTITLAVENGCATAHYPKGGTATFCGRTSFRQYAIVRGDKFGANVVSYSGNSVFCKVTDDVTGDIIKADFGYAGGAAICMTNAV